LGDLEIVVHQPDRGEAGVLRLAGDRGQPGRDVAAPARPREARQLQSKGEGHRILLLSSGRGGCVDELGRDEDDVVVFRRDHRVEAFGRDACQYRADAAQLGGERRRRDGIGALAIAPPNVAFGNVEDGGDDRNSTSSRDLDVAAAPRSLQRRRVDHGRQPPPETVVDDEIEHFECCRAGPLVLLACANHCPQSVRGDHLLGSERARRPCRLAAPCRSDDHYEAGVGEPGHPCHAAPTAREATGGRGDVGHVAADVVASTTGVTSHS
jgi:hypothetical protein